MAYGVVESDGLRCPYHGWTFDTVGAAATSPPRSTTRRFYCRRSECGRTGEIAPSGETAIGHEPSH